MQLNKLVLDVNEHNKIVECLKCKMRYTNISIHLKLSKVFYSASDYAFKYIDCCLMTIYKTTDFLQLDVDLLEKILGSSGLLVTSEIDVYHVAKEWIGHKLKKRGKFTKRLLQKIRTPLLSRRTLEEILKIDDLSFAVNKEFCLAINETLSNNDSYKNKSNKYLATRYCSHNQFDVLCFGGLKPRMLIYGFKSVDNKIKRIDNSDGFKSSEVVSSLVKERCDCKVVHIRGNFYIFVGSDKNGYSPREVEKYNLFTKSCEVIATLDDVDDHEYKSFALCGFADKIYLLGGYSDVEKDYCVEFDTNKHSWEFKSGMQDERENPAACVFEEKIIVSGGMLFDAGEFARVNRYDEHEFRAISTAEAYDPIQDYWELLPDMNFTRCKHVMVAVHNKLFVIGGGTEQNEVYDSTSGRFTVLKPPLSLHDTRENNAYSCFSVGSKLFVCFSNSTSAFSYDVTTREWCEEPWELVRHLSYFSATAAPRL